MDDFLKVSCEIVVAERNISSGTTDSVSHGFFKHNLSSILNLCLLFNFQMLLAKIVQFLLTFFVPFPFGFFSTASLSVTATS